MHHSVDRSQPREQAEARNGNATTGHRHASNKILEKSDGHRVTPCTVLTRRN